MQKYFLKGNPGKPDLLIIFFLRHFNSPRCRNTAQQTRHQVIKVPICQINMRMQQSYLCHRETRSKCELYKAPIMSASSQFSSPQTCHSNIELTKRKRIPQQYSNNAKAENPWAIKTLGSKCELCNAPITNLPLVSIFPNMSL